MQLQKVKETCIYISDLDKAEAFYNGLLGLPLISRKEGRHIFFRVGDDVLLCFIAAVTRYDTHLPPHYATGHQHFALECKAGEYELWKEKLKAEGIPIEHEEDWGKGFQSIYFRDPDDNCVEIVMPGMWERYD